jgi:NAD(P)H-dependent flavin oxidoreductase YrpB (nitropropane dioxygenase family)
VGGKISFEDIVPELAGVYPRIMKQGDMDAGAWSCGVLVGLIHDIPPVKELIERTVREAEAIVSQRLSRLMAA